MLQLRQPAQVEALDRLVVVEIDERHLVMSQHVAQAARRDQVLDVAPVAGPLGDDHLGGPFATAQLDDGGDQVRMRVDHLVAVILDQIRLEDHPFAFERHLGPERFILSAYDIGNIRAVVAHGGDVDRRWQFQWTQLRLRR